VNRRAFLRRLAVGAAAIAIEQAIPDVARTYFLPPPAGWRRTSGDLLVRDSRELGISIRFVREFTIENPTRVDVPYGWATLRPELACRILLEDTAHEGARARRRRKRQEAFALKPAERLGLRQLGVITNVS
jgi:hypothetical protein